MQFVHIIIAMEFEWDHQKNKHNLKKHGLVFEDAEFIFSGKTITFEDDRFDYGEKRYITVGKLKTSIVVAVHTYREQKIRIISMRKANERERQIYRKRLEKVRRDER